MEQGERESGVGQHGRVYVCLKKGGNSPRCDIRSSFRLETFVPNNYKYK